MPRNFFNILRDNPESWGGTQNPLTLPTTRSSDKAQKSSATVKISAVRFLCYNFGLTPSEPQHSSPTLQLT
ncbi:hypothetical protein B5M10_15545 [Pluralibacter gergoviae]|nr:hypothetical protein A8H26_01840 [Pluralibacter gergoviae]OUQ99029.1 hypothetical protein B5M10_15545 [Pluralibacter gergoviae]PHH44850.1 hypothetical protein CRX51_03165 [Pluralibacter gergoviae]